MNWIEEGLLVLCFSTMVPNGIACQMPIGVRGGLASATATGEDLTETSRRSGIGARSRNTGWRVCGGEPNP